MPVGVVGPDRAQVDGRCRRRAGRRRLLGAHRAVRSVPRVVRVEAEQREDRLPGRQDRPVHRVRRRCPAPTARTARRRSPSVIGAAAPPGAGPALGGAARRQAGGVGVAGSSGSPVATASRWVHARGTTSTSAYPPPPVATQRPPHSSSASVAQGQVGGPLPVHGQPQVGQRVEPVRVGAALGDQHLRPERAQHRRHHRVERAQPAGVVGARRQRRR